MASMRKWTGKVAPEELADDFAGGVDKSREEHGEGLESTTDLAVPDGGVADVLEDCGVWHWLSEAARVRGGKIGSVDVKVSESGEQTARLFTYQEMYQRARDAAGFMFSRGVARHSRIAIFSTNCHDIIEVHFAAAALQATVINLNVNLKPGELRFILEDSRVDAIFAHPILAPTLEDALSEVDDAAGASQLGMPKFLVWLDSRVGGIVEAEFSCEGITYESCIDSGTDRMSEIRHHWKEDFEYQWYYTSGTTGKPKGVILRHDQICLHALSTIEEMGLQTTDVWGHISPMFHLVDAFAIYAITHVGGSHVVFPRFTALGVLDMLERERVSCTNLASTMLTMLIHHPTCWGRDYTSLRIMSCGGSPQSNSNVKKTISIFGCEFFVSYGMTECCGKISMSLLPKDRRKLSLENQVQLICTSGRPFISIELKVLQEDGSEVIWDDRSLGEIVVKGPTVFDGYFRLQDSKSKHFHGEWFRTGDVAHVSSLGYITIADRIKDMILCGGENVYCVEVENVLHAHPSVKQAAVFGTKDDIMGELVNAAIVLKDEETTGNRTSEIRSYCRERMSAYKVPTKYYFLLQMPTTSSGKIMKNRLRDMFGPTMEQHSHKPVMRSSIWEVCGYRQTLSSHLVESGESCAVVIASESDCLRRVLDALDLSQLSMARIVICTDRDMSDTVLSMVDRFPHFQLYLVVVPSLDALNVTSDRSLPVDLEVLIMHVAEVNANSIFVFDQNSFESMLDGLASLNQEFSQQLTTNGEHIEEMRSSLQGRVAEIAGKLLEQNVDVEQQLMEYGMTSSQAVEFAVEVEEAFGLAVPSTLVFDYPTISDVSAFLEEKISSSIPNKSGTSRTSIRRLIADSLEEEAGLEVDDGLSGLNSSQAVSFVSKLNTVLGIDLPSTLVFDYPDVEGLVGAVSSTVERLSSKLTAESVPQQVYLGNRHDSMPSQVCYLVGSFSTKDSQKQVVGTSCTKDLISRVPTGRWDRMWDNSIDVLPHFGFFLAEVESFDPQLFRISESEAVEMDPQQRQLLQSWSNCHHAMSIPKETAVFVGVSQLDYSILLWAIRLRNSKLGTSTFSATSSHLSVVSGRLSYSFGYTGQCLSIDTACSSSLVVVHLATNAMKNDDVRSAGISGVNLLIARTWSQACHSAGMLSMDGRCKVLDESADGYVRSEECASAYLSCDPRYGSYSIVILSSAVNQDGRSSTLTAPNGPAQQSVVSRAFTESRSPVFLQRLQMHGTGTSLGDPIEVGAILAVSDNFDDQSGRPLELQAGKSQHGHSEPAAGLSALLTSLTAGLKSENAEICHLISLNPHVSHLLDSTTTSRNLSAPRSQQAQPTPNDDATGSCGVSAFAFQGTNAHVQFSCGSGKDFVHKVNVNSEPTFLWAIGGVSLSSNFCFVHHTFHDAVFDFNLKINDTDSFNVLSDGRKEAFSLFFIQNLAWSCLYELYRNQMCITNSCLHSSLLLSRKMPSMCLKIQVSSNSQCSIFSNESSQRMVADSLISSALPSSESRATLGKRNEPLDSEESTETILHSKVTLASANIFVALEQAHKVCNNHRDLNPVTMKMIMIKEGLLSERNDSANGCFGKAGYRCTKSVQVCSSTAEVLAEVNDVQYGSSYKLQVLRKDNIQEDKFVYSSMWIANSTDEEIEVSSRRKVMDVAKSESITTYALSSISLLQRMQMKDSIASTFTSTSSAPPVLGPASSDGLQGVMASVLTALCRVYENTIGKVAMITMYDIHNEYGTRHSSFTHERQIVQDKYARLLKASISYTPRLCPVQISTFSNQHMKGTTMITGGTGALGNIIKDLLQKKCKAFTYLLGRTKRITKIRKYENIIQISTNVSFAEDCHLLGGLGVQGVMHAGGVLADSVLSNQTAQSVKQVFAPKVVGLHQLAKTFAMEAMGAQVLFSSVAALLGSAGQTNYAAANAVLDAQAHMWQNAGVSAVSVQWGPWASGGMAVKHAKRMEQMGLYMLSPYEGLFALESIAGRVCGGGGCLDNAMWSSHAQVAVQRFMWDRFLSRMTHVPPLFSNMHDTASHGHGSSIDATRMSNTSASAASGMTLDADVLQQKVKEAVHAVVGHEVSPDDPLMAAGLDSLGAMELRSSLEQSLGIDLPGMLIFDYPSVHAIIEYAETLLGPKQVPLASAAISTGIRTVSEGSVSVHMLSLAARLPTPEHNLCQTSNAGDSIWRVPHMRWDADEDYKDGAPIVPIRFGGFLDGIELFDIPCFGVSRSEACWMDPHQRLLLEVSYEALHSMESDSSSSWMHQKQRMGVMVGTQHVEYSNIYAGYGHKSEVHAVTSGSLSVSAGRLSFTYGLQGACAAVDTACSSSLVAAHMSYMGLVLGQLSKGLVCGVDLQISRDTFGSIQRAGMLAPDGRCKTLDASADGYVRAEACIACVLGPLEDGSKQDTVMLRGTAVNQDGRSSALTAPHGPSQQQVMRMSLHSADLDAWSAQVLQMHGTGTPLGGPIEVGAASAVLLSEATKRDFPVHMSGVESNMGHSEAAAGMAGMVQLAGNLLRSMSSSHGRISTR